MLRDAIRFASLAMFLICLTGGSGKIAAAGDGDATKTANLPPIPEATAAKIDDYLKPYMEREQVPGLSLAIVRNGRVTFAKGYGLANVELKVPATPETVYQIQSITKQFTATGIMMLVEEGKLDLDEKVGHYLEGTPSSWENITLRQLLTHTSGIKDFINEPTVSLRLDVTEEEVLKATAARPLNFAPGERYAYCNTNYHLLAMIIRKVTGKSFGEFLRERIFVPLEMNDTRLYSQSDIIPNRASGYLRRWGGLRNGAYIATTVLAYGGGGICSTVLDMAKWDAALYGEKLLKKASLDLMWTPARLNDGKTDSYGFGWNVGEIRGHRYLSHGGAHQTGFTSHIGRFPDDGLTVIVLTNARHANPGRIAVHVVELCDPRLARAEQ
jgi:CubicO group peptidase (beta-lactamase class C family)